MTDTARPSPSSPFSRWWALLLVVPAVVFVVCTETSPSFGQQFHVVRAIDASDVATGVSGIRRGVAVDAAFIAAWLATVPWLTSRGRSWLRPFQRAQLRHEHAWRIALAAGCLDVLEDVLLLVATYRQPDALLVVLAAVGWVKYAAYVAAAVGAVGMVRRGALGGWVDQVMERVGELTVERYSRSPRHPSRTSHVEPAPGCLPATTPAAAGGLVAATRRRIRAYARGFLGRAAPAAPGPSGAAPAGPPPAGTTVGGPGPAGVGICVSGGGIRAAGIALGALAALDVPQGGNPSVFRSARWLCSVSGGGFTAAGWRLARTPTNDGCSYPPPGALSDGLLAAGSPWRGHVRRRRRYLENGWLSLLGGLVGALVRSILVLSGAAAVGVLLGWAVGRWVRSDLVAPDLPEALVGVRVNQLPPPGIVFFDQLWWPGLVVMMLGALLLLLGAARREGRTLRAAARWTLAGGAALLVVLQGLAALIAYTRHPTALLGVDRETPLTALLSSLSGIGIVSAIGGLLVARLQRSWLRLGGVLVAVLVLVLAGEVAQATLAEDTEAAVRTGFFTDPLALVWVSVAVLVVLNLVDSHRLTLAGIYRKRTAATFATRWCGEPVPLTYDQEPAMAEYRPAGEGPRPAGPQLIMAATAHSSTPTVAGLKGAGITFDDTHIHLYDGKTGPPSCVVTSSFPEGSAWRGYPRSWSYSRAMALSGAALASALGRHALGTTTALLAVANLRLGMWIPNPARAAEDFGPGLASQPRVGLSYLVKEVFGRYDLAKDPFIYVADGGHRDNLGLVELLRRRPREVYVVDASGDAPGTFRALRQAIDLAELELGIGICMDWDPIRHGAQEPTEDRPVLRAVRSTPPTMPFSCATTGTVTYADGATAELFYARNQVALTSSPELRAFAGGDRRFPDYSTADQFLRDVQFANLVALGEEMGTRLVGLHDPGRRRPCRSG